MPDDHVRVAAVDLGASSGRVLAVDVSPGSVDIAGTHRFPNRPVRTGPTLQWDILDLYREVLDGIRIAAGRAGELASVGIDSWAVDYGLLDSDGELLGNPVHYRDARTDGITDLVHRRVPVAELYATTGVQVLPFNTIYQLAASSTSARSRAARQLLLIPDLLGYWLTGVRVAEVTNASTTGLLDVRSRCWAAEVLRRVGIDPELLPPMVEAGTPIGQLTPAILGDLGLTGPVTLTAVGSHDTASAVAGVPSVGNKFAFISCGTWSLVGVELDRPVLSDESRLANFSNELGVDNTVRYLRNVMGLWLLQECLRAWRQPDLDGLLDAARYEPALAAVVDASDPSFIPPGDMPARIAAACARSGQPEPRTPPAVVRCVLDSLALAHRRTIREAAALSGRPVKIVHLVGGGALNRLLCQLTADACGLPLVAGPVEAAALSNALLQARTLGVVSGGLAELRAVLRGSVRLARYEPRGDVAAWQAAEERLGATSGSSGSARARPTGPRA